MNEFKHSYNKSRQGREEFQQLLDIKIAQGGKSKKRGKLVVFLSENLKVPEGTVSTQLATCSFKDYEKAVELIEKFFKERK